MVYGQDWIPGDKIDKNQLPYHPYIDNVASHLGLKQVWAYHCHRCNYTWLPKDFDLDMMECFKENPRWLDDVHSIFFREPPKSCARCKSKYWKYPFRYRKTKHVSNIDAPYNEKSIARFRALLRQGELDKAAKLRPEFSERLMG